MCFVGEPFKHDLFVSYSHGSIDGRGTSLLKTWSGEFVEDLERQIRQIRHFRAVRVFLDQNQRPGQGVDPTAPLTETLKDEIAASALLVILMTPDYLASRWCEQERDWWISRHMPDAIGAGGRIFVCRVLPNVEDLPWEPEHDHKPWPSALKDSAGEALPGFWFHSRDDVDDATVPFRWDGVTHDLNEYDQARRELIRVVTARLRKIKQRLNERRREKESQTGLAGPGRKIIYLHGREAHAEAWQRARDALVRSGYVIYPSVPETNLLSQELLDFRQIKAARHKRILQLGECDAILILCVAYPSDELDIDLAAIGRKDRESARDLSNKFLPCAVLDLVGKPIDKATEFAIERLDGRKLGWEMEVASWLERCARLLTAVAA
jgi:hypothetical protein